MTVRLSPFSLTVLLLSCPILAANNCSTSQYYNSTSNQCTNCPSSCYFCTNSFSCSICAPAYFKANTGCLPCSTHNCASCPNNTCIACSPNYELTIEDSCVLANSAFKMAYLVASISLGVLVFIGCCCYCLNKCRETVSLTNFNRAPSLPIRHPYLHALPAEAVSQMEIRFDETWREDEDFQQRKKETCPFCLDSLVNLQLPCKHLYHLTCIAQWLQKHRDCPVCKRYISGQATLYCQQCFTYDLKFDSVLITAHKVMEKRICERCAIASQQIIIQAE